MDLELVGDYHFGCEFRDLLLRHLEKFGEAADTEGLILAGSSEQERLQSRLLEHSGEHCVVGVDLRLGLALEEADVHDVADSLAPVRLVQRAGRHDNGVTVLLSCQVEGTLVVVLDQSLERPGNDEFVHGELVLSVVGNLEQHSADEVRAVEHLQVNLHVEGDLSLVLLLLILGGLLLVAGKALSEELLVLLVVLDVDEQVVRLLDFTQAEGGKASLRQGSVVHDLVVDVVHVVDQLAHVRLHHQVLGLAQSVVQGVVVHVVEGGAVTETGLPD